MAQIFKYHTYWHTSPANMHFVRFNSYTDIFNMNNTRTNVNAFVNFYTTSTAFMHNIAADINADSADLHAGVTFSDTSTASMPTTQ